VTLSSLIIIPYQSIHLELIPFHLLDPYTTLPVQDLDILSTSPWVIPRQIATYNSPFNLIQTKTPLRYVLTHFPITPPPMPNIDRKSKSYMPCHKGKNNRPFSFRLDCDLLSLLGIFPPLDLSERALAGRESIQVLRDPYWLLA